MKSLLKVEHMVDWPTWTIDLKLQKEIKVQAN